MNFPTRTSVYIDQLARTIAEVEPNVKDYLEVAVILEILGVTDETARAHGYDGVFALAREVEPLVEMYRPPPGAGPTALEKRRSAPVLFLLGMFYNLWWVIMLVALFLGGQSLWASVNLPPAIATSIGLGVILGLVTTGGMQQFASWKMTYYLLQDNKPLARFVVDKALFWGLVLLFGVGAAYVLVNEYLFPMGFGITAVTVLYLLLIGLFRLMVVPVYALKRYLPLFLSAIVALVFMFSSLAAFQAAGLPRVSAVVGSQVTGLFALIAVSGTFLYLYVYREELQTPGPDEPPFYSRPEKPKHVRPPQFVMLFHDGLPYVAYGSLFFLYLFADRLVAWRNLATPGLAYNAAYQIGVDMALLLLIPLTGIKFVFIYRLSDSMRTTLRGIRVTHPAIFGRWLAAFYGRMMVALWVAGLLFVVVAWLLSDRIIAFAGGNRTSLDVFRLAIFGVFFFSVFLANAVFSLAFRRTWGLSILLAIGTIANFVLASTFATSGNSAQGVLGFVVTAMYLGIASSGYVYSFASRADYAHYTAM